jgi:hypothetical protein
MPPPASAWVDGESRPIFLQFSNQTSEAIDLFWLDYEGKETPFGSVSKGRVLGQVCAPVPPLSCVSLLAFAPRPRP